MTDSQVGTTAHDVYYRLRKIAREEDRPFHDLLVRYGMERLLYRLGQSQHSGKFALKGGLMLLVWGTPTRRYTMDVDLLGHFPNSVEAVVEVIRDACEQEVEDDGFVFDPSSTRGEEMNPDKEYPGVRVHLLAYLGKAKVPLKIEMGFGDVVVPGEEWADYPTILGFGAPRIKAYPKECFVAEKLEAMVKLGEANTRMKDFYDLWLLPREYAFDGKVLAEAVGRTFENRRTAVRADPACFTSTFGGNKQRDWAADERQSELPASDTQNCRSRGGERSVSCR